MTKSRLLLLPLFLAGLAGFVVLAAGCGGGGSKTVPANAVALVKGQAIPKSQFDELMGAAEGQNKARGQTAPKVGTSAYSQLRDQAVAYLVQSAEFEQEGQKLGVTVSQKDVAARMQQLVQQYGGAKKFAKAVKASGLTVPQVQILQRIDLVGNKLYTKVTAGAKASKADAQKYYDQNKASYTTTAKTRNVAHILVSSKKQAESLETKLAHGADFATLAKKYSTDTTTGQNGGKLCIAHGSASGACQPTVAPFDKEAFKLETGAISPPVHSQYGWHIIKALGPVIPAHTAQPFSQVASQIEQNLVQQKQSSLWSTFLAKVQKDYAHQVTYQTGYTPPATTTSTTSTVPTTTG